MKIDHRGEGGSPNVGGYKLITYYIYLIKNNYLEGNNFQMQNRYMKDYLKEVK